MWSGNSSHHPQPHFCQLGPILRGQFRLHLLIHQTIRPFKTQMLIIRSLARIRSTGFGWGKVVPTPSRRRQRQYAKQSPSGGEIFLSFPVIIQLVGSQTSCARIDFLIWGTAKSDNWILGYWVLTVFHTASVALLNHLISL